MIKLYHGECLIEMNNIPDGSVDMILCDPPYGATACKWDVVIPFEEMWKQTWRVLKPNGACVLFGSQPFFSHMVVSAEDFFRYELIWEKCQPSNFLFLKSQFGRVHENIAVFYRKQPTYNPQMWDAGKPSSGGTSKKPNTSATQNNQTFKAGDHTGSNLRFPRGVIKFHKEKKAVHPTQKPVVLLEYLIKTYTSEGETVLDFTMGSGSTGVACVNTLRSFIGIEKDDRYFEIARERIDKAGKEKPLTLF